MELNLKLNLEPNIKFVWIPWPKIQSQIECETESGTESGTESQIQSHIISESETETETGTNFCVALNSTQLKATLRN